MGWRSKRPDFVGFETIAEADWVGHDIAQPKGKAVLDHGASKVIGIESDDGEAAKHSRSPNQ